MRKLLRIAAAAFVVGASQAVFLPSARADASAEDKAQAESLFEAAEKLYQASNFTDALPKFLESNRLDPAAGTMLYIGECYVQLGKSASGWAAFQDALDFATKTNNPERAGEAQKRIDQVGATLSKLTIAAAPGAADVPGLQITRDGKPVGAGQLGVAVAVDGGAHTITAIAPNKKAWQHVEQVAPNDAQSTVTIPVLEDAPSTTPIPATTPATTAASSPPPAAITSTSAATPPSPSSWGTQKIAGVVVAGAGVVGLAVGGVFGLSAKSSLDDSNDGHCRTSDNHCDAQGVQLRSDAQSSALISTIAFGAGAAAVVGGAILFFTAPKTTAPRTGWTVAPAVGARDAGFMLRGSF